MYTLRNGVRFFEIPRPNCGEPYRFVWAGGNFGSFPTRYTPVWGPVAQRINVV